MPTGASEGGDRLSVREQDFHGRHMPGTGGKAGGKLVNRGIAPPWEPDYGDSRQIIAEKVKKKPEPELFQFDPNTVTTEELVRLGFSERQAQVIATASRAVPMRPAPLWSSADSCSA